MSWISITSRSSLAANYYKHWFCFYASSICLKAFVYIPGLAFLPLPILVSCLSHLVDYFAVPVFLKYIINLQQTTSASLVVSLSASVVLHSSFTTLLYKNIQIIFANILYFSANWLVTCLFILSLFFPFSEYFCLLRNISVA